MPTAPTRTKAAHTSESPAVDGGWDRRRLLAGTAVAAAVVVLLVAGLVYAVVWTVHTTTDASAGRGPLTLDTSSSAAQRRDAIAAAPMLTVDPQAATGGTPAAIPGPTMVLPEATSTGPGDVPTGFPHTASGAVAQLAAISTAVLSSMSIEYASAVHQGWALPGAPDAPHWVMTTNVQAFLAAAGVPATDQSVLVTAVPVAAQVKGVDGSDWVLACVLLDVQATVTTRARIGYGHCERLQWDAPTRRWMIAPGAQPAPAPSTWPGTQTAVDAGWVTLAAAGQD